jgi:hypothetical protein
LYWQSLSDRGSNSRQVSRPSSLGSSISDVRDEAPAANTQPSTPITTQQQPTMAAAAAAVASGAMTPNGDIDYKKVNNPLPNRKKKMKIFFILSKCYLLNLFIYLFIVCFGLVFVCV